jgi:signal transduction histidine kinase
MLHVVGSLPGHHDPKLVLVALFLCLVGSWTAVTLASRARSALLRWEMLWTCAAAFVFGASVWSMHFVAMLALHASTPIFYDFSWTALSIAVAIAFSFVGFETAIHSGRRWLGGAVVGCGVGAMHYVGMQALEGSFRLVWDGPIVALSLVVGIALAALAMQSEKWLPPIFGRVSATVLFAASVGGLHFVGMRALAMLPDPIAPRMVHSFPPEALATMVVAVSLLIVFVGLSSAYLDLYLEHRRSDESTRLRTHIAELEATKLELGLALETAFAASKSKSAFLAAMSHELRTPLNAIIGFSELMTTEAFGPLGSLRYKSYSEDIRNSGNHLLHLINDILDISRLEARKAELIEIAIALPDLMLEARAMVENQARIAGVALTFELQPSLPLLKADARRVKQIVLNLLSNAIKFTPAGGRVSVSARLQNGAIEIAVADTGIGIEKADLPKAFESFGQIDSRLSRRYEGSGLGLPLARHLAELHGATLIIESEVDRGTVGTVCFPASRSIVQSHIKVA